MNFLHTVGTGFLMVMFSLGCLGMFFILVWGWIYIFIFIYEHLWNVARYILYFLLLIGFFYAIGFLFTGGV
jgi:hypothetical protein